MSGYFYTITGNIKPVYVSEKKEDFRNEIYGKKNYNITPTSVNDFYQGIAQEAVNICASENPDLFEEIKDNQKEVNKLVENHLYSLEYNILELATKGKLNSSLITLIDIANLSEDDYMAIEQETGNREAVNTLHLKQKFKNIPEMLDIVSFVEEAIIINSNGAKSAQEYELFINRYSDLLNNDQKARLHINCAIMAINPNLYQQKSPTYYNNLLKAIEKSSEYNIISQAQELIDDRRMDDNTIRALKNAYSRAIKEAEKIEDYSSIHLSAKALKKIHLENDRKIGYQANDKLINKALHYQELSVHALKKLDPENIDLSELKELSRLYEVNGNYKSLIKNRVEISKRLPIKDKYSMLIGNINYMENDEKASNIKILANKISKAKMKNNEKNELLDKLSSQTTSGMKEKERNDLLDFISETKKGINNVAAKKIAANGGGSRN